MDRCMSLSQIWQKFQIWVTLPDLCKIQISTLRITWYSCWTHCHIYLLVWNWPSYAEYFHQNYYLLFNKILKCISLHLGKKKISKKLIVYINLYLLTDKKPLIKPIQESNTCAARSSVKMEIQLTIMYSYEFWYLVKLSMFSQLPADCPLTVLLLSQP